MKNQQCPEVDPITKSRPKVRLLYPPDITTVEFGVLFSLYLKALEKLSKEGFDVGVIGRMPESAFRKTYDTSLSYLDFFKSGQFSRKLSQKEVEDAETYMGLPFNYILFANQKRWHWLSKPGLYEKAAREVYAWKDALKDTDVILPTLDNLFFLYSAERVADRMGVKIIKPIRGRLVNDSLIFWDKDNLPIYYKTDYGGDIAEKFTARALSQKTNVKIAETAIIKTENLRKRLMDVPRKFKLLFQSNRAGVDADIPAFIPKYKRLISMGLRLLVYPKLHALFFERPKKEAYFLFPLHYEWEAQLAFREPFISQLGLAKQISEILPSNTYLYIKVHPHWKNADQSLRAVYGLRKAKNVRFIHPEENTTDLVRNSLGVIIINSTVGYEAILLKKPLVVLGHEAYKEAAIDMKDLAELPKTLARIKSGEYKVDATHYENFLKKYAGNITSTNDPEKFTHELKNVILWVLQNG